MRKVSLANNGAEHFATVLKGECGLSAYLQKCDLTRGQYSAVVPSGPKTYDVSRPSVGGLLSAPEARQIFSSLADHLKTEIIGAEGGTVVVQSPWSQASDAIPRCTTDDLLLQADFGVCHSSKIDDLNEDELEYMLNDTIAGQYVACIIKRGISIEALCSMGESEFCDAVVAAFVPAYDGESAVIWEKNIRNAST